ncbi:hypothetical protein [Holospora curviuscula]|uniref:Uncharacterized protein n=1 Tax=Holospora curviuscula TaxID=1082868 RepID=A0A2S5R7T9_9PROT|nr:hypothetical protein [Holospora curviuscula]PPE03185.1 hypothetical protein HCUR_01385 [Holospora curviuscula]
MRIKQIIFIWIGGISCTFGQVQSESEHVSQTLRKFLNWVYKKKPELYTSLPRHSDEILRMYSEQLAQHIIYVQSVKNSSDMYSTDRKTFYQRTLFELMKKDQKIYIRASPNLLNPPSKKEEAPPPEPVTAQNIPEILGVFILKQELENRTKDRKLRTDNILQQNPHNKETVSLLVDGLYDEIFHRIYLWTRYAQSLCFQDPCVEKIQTILSASMDNFMKIKQLLPLLHTLEQENTRYAHTILASQEPKEPLEILDFKLPGVRITPSIQNFDHQKLLHNVLKLYPNSPSKQKLYHKLCITFLVHMMGEMALHPTPPSSILALILDATAELHRQWDMEKFKNLLLYWPDNNITSALLTKHLKKLSHIIPLAFAQQAEWKTIIDSCEAEYTKITDMIQKIIKRL